MARAAHSVYSLWVKYLALIRRGLGILLEYRGAMLIWMLSASFPLVMLAVWNSLAAEGPIGGFTASDFVTYYLLSFYLRQMTAVWVAWELDYEIQHGDLSVKLLHPINPVHDYISMSLADKIIRFFIFTPILLIAFGLFPEAKPLVTPECLTFFGLALIVAWLLRFFSQYFLGLFGFWFSQALVLPEIFWMLFLLFGGGVAPLELLPAPLQAIASWLPFRFMMAFPIQIMMGQLSPEQILGEFVAAGVWVAVFVAAAGVAWRRGLRRFSAFGA